MVGRGADLYSAVGWFLADETTQRLLHRQEAGLMMNSNLSALSLMTMSCPYCSLQQVYFYVYFLLNSW